MTQASLDSHVARPRRVGGFTLIEVLVTMSIMAIMLGLAAPSFVSFQRNSELTATANSFVGALAAARSEALKRQLNVFVVPQDGSWANGLTIFADVNRDSALTPSGTDVVIMRTDKIPSSVTTLAYTGGAYIEFNGSGFMTTVANSIALAGSLDFVGTPNTEVRRVITSPAGRLRVCKPADNGCNKNDL